MCDACSAEGSNYIFKNKDRDLYRNNLYNVFRDGIAQITLCRIHDIELFKVGEFNFLKKNIPLASRIGTSIGSDNNYFSYG